MRPTLPLRVAPLAGALTLCAGATPPAAVLEPGNWMYSVESVTNGRPDAPRSGEECLDEQLKDLGAYFAPRLEGAQARCETSRKTVGTRIMDYRMQCRGDGFTMVTVTRVTIEDSRRVTIRSELESRTMQGESRVVSVGEALRTGACRKR